MLQAGRDTGLASQRAAEIPQRALPSFPCSPRRSSLTGEMDGTCPTLSKAEAPAYQRGRRAQRPPIGGAAGRAHWERVAANRRS